MVDAFKVHLSGSAVDGAYLPLKAWIAKVAAEAMWRQHCWFTDLVKCSTIAESNAGVPPQAIAACRRHLVEEILTVRPEVVAVLGGAVMSPVRTALAEARSTATPLLLLHPARWRRLDSDRQRQSFLHSSAPAAGRRPDSEAFSDVLERLQAELA